jgi:hypothetical protein
LRRNVCERSRAENLGSHNISVIIQEWTRWTRCFDHAFISIFGHGRRTLFSNPWTRWTVLNMITHCHRLLEPPPFRTRFYICLITEESDIWANQKRYFYCSGRIHMKSPFSFYFTRNTPVELQGWSIRVRSTMPNNAKGEECLRELFVIDRGNYFFSSAISFLPVNLLLLNLFHARTAIQYEMEAPESRLSTSSAASEAIHSKDEADQTTYERAESNDRAQNADIGSNKEEKKSFRFKLTVFMLCFISVVVAMASPLFLRTQSPASYYLPYPLLCLGRGWFIVSTPVSTLFDDSNSIFAILGLSDSSLDLTGNYSRPQRVKLRSILGWNILSFGADC